MVCCGCGVLRGVLQLWWAADKPWLRRTTSKARAGTRRPAPALWRGTPLPHTRARARAHAHTTTTTTRTRITTTCQRQRRQQEQQLTALPTRTHNRIMQYAPHQSRTPQTVRCTACTSHPTLRAWRAAQLSRIRRTFAMCPIRHSSLLLCCDQTLDVSHPLLQARTSTPANLAFPSHRV